MSIGPASTEDRGAPERLGWATPIAVALFYAACVAAATWPQVVTFGSTLPSLTDPLQHLWIMRWYKTCLLEGRSPLLCPEIQYPVGAPLGNFSPLHLQALLYIPLSLVLANDVLCFNLIWLVGMVTTGLATFLLIWRLLRDRLAATFGGMTAMLSAPMMFHAQAHLELIFLGGFPLFLLVWIDFIDQPTRKRLALAVGAYGLVALCAAYYVVFAVVPAALYFIWQAVAAGREGIIGWARERARWLLAFAALATPLLALIFANQIWSMAQGYALPRPMSEFIYFRSPWWSYLAPTTFHRLGRLLPFNPYAAFGFETIGERASYLGVVTVALLLYSLLGRVRFPRGRFWWALLVVLVVLSLGAYAEVGGCRIDLPALWLKKTLVLFALIRVPARFNLFAAVVAAVVAAAGLKHLLARLPGRGGRWVVAGALILMALLDLSFPASLWSLPPMPACYQVIRARQPSAKILEIPQAPSTGSFLSAVGGYWASHHRLPTNVGYSGNGNVVYDDLVTWSSPFLARNLAAPGYLSRTEETQIDIACEVDFDDYIWLYLTTLGIDYLIIHQWPGALPDLPGPVDLAPLKARLERAKVYEDAATAVYERARLIPPRKPVVLVGRGWHPCADSSLIRVSERSSQILAYNPDPDRPLRFALRAKGFRGPHTVRLRDGRTELARWEFAPHDFQLQLS
ncbi:MAG: hypothetical protein IRY99_09345, partial [Isosphaeraceae bacterium]|nr:hypothetical protein [Isosphaeraceae bacterium]